MSIINARGGASVAQSTARRALRKVKPRKKWVSGTEDEETHAQASLVHCKLRGCAAVYGVSVSLGGVFPCGDVWRHSCTA